jgi:hypothetical protein
MKIKDEVYERERGKVVTMAGVAFAGELKKRRAAVFGVGGPGI